MSRINKIELGITNTETSDCNIEDNICNLILDLDLDLMIEFPPSDLNILIDECHSINEEIHSLLVQSTLNSVEGSKIISLSKHAEETLKEFLKFLLTSGSSFLIKIGDCLDSSELAQTYAQIVTNLHNVYYIDSRKVNSFYSSLIEETLFGAKSPLINMTEVMKNDVLNGKSLINSFVRTLLFANFQDTE